MIGLRTATLAARTCFSSMKSAFLQSSCQINFIYRKNRTITTMVRTIRPNVLGLAPSGVGLGTSFPIASANSMMGVTATLAPRISASPVLRALQVRNGPRDTYDPSHRVRKRRAGFLARNRSRTGRAILKRRQLKGRKTLSH